MDVFRLASKAFDELSESCQLRDRLDTRNIKELQKQNRRSITGISRLIKLDKKLTKAWRKEEGALAGSIQELLQDSLPSLREIRTILTRQCKTTAVQSILDNEQNAKEKLAHLTHILEENHHNEMVHLGRNAEGTRLEQYAMLPQSGWQTLVKLAAVLNILLNIHEEESVAPRRRILATGTKIAAGLVLAPAATKVFETYLMSEAEKLPVEKKNGLAIFILGPTETGGVGAKFLESLIMPFWRLYAARIELLFGFRALVVKRYFTKEDFLRAIRDERIHNLAVLSHGDNRWISTYDNEHIGADDFMAQGPVVQTGFRAADTNFSRTRFHSKRGFFLKHTCGELLEAHPNRPQVPSHEIQLFLHKKAEEIQRLRDQYARCMDRMWEKENLDERSPMHRQCGDLFRQITAKEQDCWVLLGTLFPGEGAFPEGHISYWERITTAFDFLVDPIHNLPLKDQFKDKIAAMQNSPQEQKDSNT